MKKLIYLTVLMVLVLGAFSAAGAQVPEKPAPQGPLASTGTAPRNQVQSLAGSFVTFDPAAGGDSCYIPGLAQTFCFRAESFTTDWEYVYDLWMKFPADWTVTDVTVAGTPSCTTGTWGDLSWSFETAPYEVDLYHPRYQASTDHCIATYCFAVTPGAGPADALESWYWDGDDYGAAPHAPCSADVYTPPSMAAEPCDEWVNPQAAVPPCDVEPGVYLLPPEQSGEGCQEDTVEYSLTVLNQTGSDGTFALGYSSLWPISGPADISVANGATADFAVAVTIPCGGEADTALVTATGNGFSDSATLTTGLSAGGWAQIASEPSNGRMDNVVAAYDGKLWSVAGYGADANVRSYDPAADAWTVVGTPAPFGASYARSGCTYGDTVYMYGDAGTAGFTGLWAYDMGAGTWTNLTPAGTPPPLTGIWAPAWAADPGTGVCYLTGGASAPGAGNLTTVYAYDPAANAWLAPLPNFTSVRDFHAAFLFTRPADGHKLLCVAGGNNGAGLSSTQCYDFVAGAWNAENADLGALPADLWAAGYTQVVQGGTDPQLWLTAGVLAGAISQGTWYYDVNAGTWNDGGLLASGAVYRTAAVALGGEVYKLGGSVGSFTYTGWADHLVRCEACEPGGEPMHLNRIKMLWREALTPGYWKVIAQMRIHDEMHSPVAGAVVYAEWTYPDGLTHPGTAVGPTDALGRTKFRVRHMQEGLYQICVTGVTAEGYSYDPAANDTEACAEVLVGP